MSTQSKKQRRERRFRKMVVRAKDCACITPLRAVPDTDGRLLTLGFAPPFRYYNVALPPAERPFFALDEKGLSSTVRIAIYEVVPMQYMHSNGTVVRWNNWRFVREQ